MRRRIVGVMAVVALSLGAAAPIAVPRRAEALARDARETLARDPQRALAQARAALALSAQFQPTDFVTAGRKGEVVEDAYQQARDLYRHHRAALYRIVGEALLTNGQPLPAARYLRRAELLDGNSGATPALARALLAAGHAQEALRALLRGAPQALAPVTLAVAEQVADAAGLPSLQVELDRARLLALPEAQRPSVREGPIVAPERARLSTGAPLRLDDPDGPTIVYVTEPSCRTCTADLEALKRLVPPGTRLYVAADDPSREQALRQALDMYRYNLPVVSGGRLAVALGLTPPVLLVCARSGLIAALITPPLAERLMPVLQVFAHDDVSEPRPRPAWNHRPVARTEAPAVPGLLPEGLASGEDDAVPQVFGEAVAAYRAGRYADALARIESLSADDGWLLPPEARLNRALCLAGLGRRDEARQTLLRIGDSRVQDAVDAALERVAAAAPRR
jgi:tetratricopeptide (TPR) repeat protein